MGESHRPKDFTAEMMDLERVLQILREQEDVEILLETTLAYLQAELDYDVIWIGLYDRLDHRLFGKGGVAPHGDISFLKQRFNLNPGDLLEQVVIQLQPVEVPDLGKEKRAGDWRKVAQAFNIQGTILFPLRYKDRCYGVVLLGSQGEGRLTPASRARLGMVFGSLAMTLYQMELNWQHQQTRRPDAPLLALISQLGTLRSLEQCLEAVVEETHKFIDPTRTNVYWFERERRYFWRRVSNRQISPALGLGDRPASGITVQDLGGFYQAMVAEQMVWIGESHSSLRSEVTGRLMQQIRARSLLAAPIILEGELLGFLAVEAIEPRIWQEDEKSYLRAAAQLVALVAPVSGIEERIRQTELDRELTAGVAQTIYSNTDWQTTLQPTAEKLCGRLSAEHFLLLLWEPELGRFEVVFQNQLPNRRVVTAPLAGMPATDQQLLAERGEALAIENWDDDRHLTTWRDALAEVGMRSLLVCSTTAQPIPEETPLTTPPATSLQGVVVVGHDAPRSWNRPERSLVEAVSRQLGLVLRQWQLQRQLEHQQSFYQSLQAGLALLQQAHSWQLSPTSGEIPSENSPLHQLERQFTQHIAEALACPLVALVTWTSGRQGGRIAAFAASNPLFALNVDVVIPVQTDTLIQQALAAEGLLNMSLKDLPLSTKRWLRSPALVQVVVAVLRTAPEHEPTGVVVVGSSHAQGWPELSLDLLRILVAQLAWSRRYLMVQEMLEGQREELEWLNWYKQRRLEELYRTVGRGVKQLGELGVGQAGSGREQKDTLATLRYQQLLRQISNALASTNLLLKQEQWRLHTAQDVIPVASLLRRSLERVDPIVKQSQLQLQVFREGQSSLPSGQVLSVRGDSLKLELVVYELLMTACRRSQPGGKIEIRCKPLDEKFLELSIEDNGVVEPQLIAELNRGMVPDILAPSTLDKPPGQHLIICQRLMRQMGGNYYIKLLENGIVASRLVLLLGTAELRN